MRAGRRQRPLQEAVQDPERVLDAVPPGQRDDHRVPVPVRCPVRVQDRGTSGEPRRGSVRAVVGGGGGRDSGGQAKVLQDRPGGAIWHRQVLRRPGVDARRQDRRLRPAQPLRQRGVAAEDEPADAGQPRPQAPPRVPGVLVVAIDADVAAPDDGRASPLQRFGHGCRLRVVQHHHVSGGDQGRQRPGVVEGSPVQRRQLLDPEHVTIARLALQMVMKALGYPEELARTEQHHPPGVDPGAFPVRQQRPKQLRDPATHSGGVADFRRRGEDLSPLSRRSPARFTAGVFISGEVLLDVSFAVAQARLASLARGGSLLSASQPACGDGITGLARAGPLGGGPGMSRLVQDVRDLVTRAGSAVPALRREAAGPYGRLFPALDAGITLTAAGEQATALELAGAYRPPPGAAGDGLDRWILHRVAAETARTFMNRVAGAIARPGGAAERERGLAGAAPSWRPPAAGAA